MTETPSAKLATKLGEHSGRADLRARVHKYLPLGAALVLPLISLLAFRFGGETGLVLVAVLLPIALGVGYILRPPAARASELEQMTGTRAEFLEQLEPFWTNPGELELSASKSACFVMEVDDFAKLKERFGHMQADLITERIGSRLRALLRPDDLLLKTGDGRYCFALAPGAHVDLEVCINIAGRIQTAVEKVVRTEQLSIHTTAAIGFCQRSHAPGSDVESWLEAAEVALSDAQSQGLGGLRGFTRDLAQKSQVHARLRKTAAAALDAGEISAWFQPQISTDTGDISGFEALARWHHPDLGVLGPNQFLPALFEANLMGKLSEVMLRQSIDALGQWDAAGLSIPIVGVNFAEDDLRDPGMADRVIWMLEQAGLPPGRLAIEVLESVVTDGQDDSVVQNISRLADVGCQVDMDDFGTGNASISAIRRLHVTRIKIDRSLVKGVDRDAEQQRVIAAVLTMTDKLGIETLGEGVETPGEHTMLAQLGCRHVQGYGIGLPMPVTDTLTWIKTHRDMLAPAPQLGGPLR